LNLPERGSEILFDLSPTDKKVYDKWNSLRAEAICLENKIKELDKLEILKELLI